MNKKLLSVFLAAGVAVVSGQSQNPNHHESEQAQESQTTDRSGQEDAQSGMQSTRARNSQAASDLLNATVQARNAVAAQNKQDALYHVDHALKRAGDISGSAQYVPIYAELSQLSVIEPIMREREQSSDPSKQAEGQKPGEQKAQSEQTPTVQSVVGQYTSVSLDVEATKSHLQAAKRALNDDKFEDAAGALKAVPQGVRVATIATDLPLLKARQNLMLARYSAMSGEQAQARAALREASQALEAYGRSSAQNAKNADPVRSEIDQFIDATQEFGSDATDRIESWWDDIAEWITDESSTG